MVSYFLPKMTPDGSRYYYYAFVPQLLPPEEQKLVERALRLLKDVRVVIAGREIPGSLLPFNIVAVRPSRMVVSLLWYAGFWSEIRPIRVYHVTINVAEGRVRGPIIAKSFEPRVESATTYNYLHHKEEMIDGLELLAVNPYLNCMSLERRMKEKRDEWVPLPWEVRVFCVESVEELIDRLKRLGSLRRPLKLIAYIGGSLCRSNFHRILFERIACRD